MLLDGRSVRTPAKAPLIVPTLPLADAIAAEWQAQGAKIDPSSMPLLQFANTAIDRVSPDMGARCDEIAAYAETDLICHWASEPAELVDRQRRHWQPLLDWLALALDAPLRPVTGVIPLSQPVGSLAALRAAVAALDAFRLTGLSVLTSITGSLAIGLAVLRGRLEPDAAWAASRVDEDYQIERWGENPEAAAHQAALREEMAAAVRYLDLLAR